MPAPAGAAGAAAAGSAVPDATTAVRTAAAAVGRAAGATKAAADQAATDAGATVATGEATAREAAQRVDASLADANARLGQAARSAPAAAGITSDTTINVAAQRLARDLSAIPGIERFGTLRLADLDRAGPRPLRTMWRLARNELADRYGEMTIGEIVDRYRGGGGPAPTA